jgi:hypothetical protein
MQLTPPFGKQDCVISLFACVLYVWACVCPSLGEKQKSQLPKNLFPAAGACYCSTTEMDPFDKILNESSFTAAEDRQSCDVKALLTAAKSTPLYTAVRGTGAALVIIEVRQAVHAGVGCIGCIDHSQVLMLS